MPASGARSISGHSGEQRQPLRESLGEMVTIANPLDYHTFVWGNREKQTAAFTAMMRGGYAST